MNITKVVALDLSKKRVMELSVSANHSSFILVTNSKISLSSTRLMFLRVIIITEVTANEAMIWIIG